MVRAKNSAAAAAVANMRKRAPSPVPNAAFGRQSAVLRGGPRGPGSAPAQQQQQTSSGKRKKRRASFRPNAVGGTPSASSSSALRGRLAVVNSRGAAAAGRMLPPLATTSAAAARGTRPCVSTSPGKGSSRRRSALMSNNRRLGANVAAGVNSGAVIAEEVCGGADAAANIRVAVRVRPENERELQMGMRNVIEIVDDRMLIFDPKNSGDEFFFKGKLQGRRDVNKREQRDHKFAFDVVFGPQSTNEEVFERTTKDLVDVLFNGYNCSVFVYGSTGAGKTFTMLGSPNNPGLTYRTVLELYQRLEVANKEASCEVAVSYLEVYNETCIDLINPGPQLAIREDGNSGVNIPGLSLHKPEGPEHLLQILQRGNQNRTQHPTDANAESSRSHAVFQVYLKQRSRTADLSTDVKVAKLSMIDLAGSERGTVAMARGATRLREGANINKSLLALGNCINALADGSKYVPFRDSKLTRLLKDSIGGNCRTVMISNVTPNAIQFEDTYNTLKYADRAKKIRIKLKKNVMSVDFHIGQYAVVVENLKTEIGVLKSKIIGLEEENRQLKEKLPAEGSSRPSSPAEETGAAAAALNQTFELVKSPFKEHAENKKIDDDQMVIRELQERLSQYEARQKDFEEMQRRLEQQQQQKPPVEVEATNSTASEAVETHKSLLIKLGDEQALKKKLELKVQFARKIVERSSLIALNDGSLQKILRYETMLQKRLQKLERRERTAAALVAESQKVVDASLAVAGEWPSRCLREEIESRELSNQNMHLLDMLGIFSEEQNRVEGILQRCLPMLKEKHLLLFDLDKEYVTNSHPEFMDLVSCVQCTKIQFNDFPDVKSFNKDSPFHLTSEDKTNKSRRLSTCGLGSFAAIVSANKDDGNEVETDLQENEEEEKEKDTAGGGGGTFEIEDHSYFSSLGAEMEVDNSCNSTFVVDEPGDKAASYVHSLVEEAEDDDYIRSPLRDLPYRPATPPKKRSSLILSTADKENVATSPMGGTPTALAVKNVQKSLFSSAAKVPLKPNNNSSPGFYTATTT